jgi:internalin A
METASPPRKPWYRRLAFRISVRTLIVLVLVVGVGLGWIGHRARVQRQAVAAIEKAGGAVSYDFQWYGLGIDPQTQPPEPWPKWLVDAVGIDYLSNVVDARFRGSEATDELMVEVGHLDHLKSLSLSYKSGGKIIGDGLPYINVRMTDAGLSHLSGLGRLRQLNLSGTAIKGPGLACLEGMANLRALDLNRLPIHEAEMAHLSGLSQLEELDLNYTNTTDAGLAHLKLLNLRSLSMSACPITTAGLDHLRGMNRLEVLWLTDTRVDSLEPLRSLRNLTKLSLYGTPITNEGLAPVANFAKLEWLRLDHTAIGDGGLVHLRGLTGLPELSLAHNTKITDAGLANLAGLSGLESLDLRQTAITDAGLAHLTGLTSCELLFVMGTAVTAEGAAALKSSRPHISVHR